MPRKEREKSALKMYHVMLRGVNKQNIFFSEDDYLRMMNILHDIPFRKDPITGRIVSSDVCTIYAYCILDNHLHILIKEGTREISDIMKIIEDRYALYYNKKYERIGHLFQSRFPSEPINDEAYFLTLLRYIHQNPVKALEAARPEDYPYSSWNEYTNNPSNVMRVLKPEAINAVLKKYPLHELSELVLSTHKDQCLDMDSFSNIISDNEAAYLLLELTNYTNIEDFRTLDPQTQIFFLLKAIDAGISSRQASRLGTVTRYQIQKALLKREQKTTPEKVGESSATGSVPLVEEKLEIMPSIEEELHKEVRKIEGLGKKTYLQMHQIIEYLCAHKKGKCIELAEQLGINPERVRKHLMILANENIIQVSGNGRNRLYSPRIVTQKVGDSSARGTDPVAEKKLEETNE